MAAGWARIRGRLREEVGEVEYRTWLRQMTLAGIEGEDAVILLPTRFLRDWVNSHYGDRLRMLWQAEDPNVRRVDIRVSAAPPAEPALAGAEDRSPPLRDGAAERGEARGLAEPLAPRAAEPRAMPESRSDWVVPLDPRFTFDNFVVGKPNEFAHACARRVAEKPASPGLQPAVPLWRRRPWQDPSDACHRLGRSGQHDPGPHRRLHVGREVHVPLHRGAALKNTMDFKEKFRSVDVLMIDDVQFIIGKDNTQEEFFHTFNALVDQSQQIVISADKSPSDLDGHGGAAALPARLGPGGRHPRHRPTSSGCRHPAGQGRRTAQVVVPPKVLEFLAHKITSNVRELEGALNRLVAHANLFGRAITLDSDPGGAARPAAGPRPPGHDRGDPAQGGRALQHPPDRHAFRPPRPRTSPGRVRSRCTSPSSSPSARLPEIGRKFGDRDHTTVMHAVTQSRN